MKEIRGKYNNAIVYTENIEETAINQIEELCNQEIFEDSKIRIMPDAHAGKGCVIGFTADMGDKIIPNLIGVDIGCGMLCVKLGKIDVNLEELDLVVNQCIPSGFNQNDVEQDFPEDIRKRIIETSDKLMIDTLRPRLSIGTLGGGNHFIELSEDSVGCKFLIIHTGSRNFGFQIAKYYQDKAVKYIKSQICEIMYMKNYEVGMLKKRNQYSAIEETIRIYDNSIESLTMPKDLCYLEGDLKDEYLHDMKVAQDFAKTNREVIGENILKNMGIDTNELYMFHTVHNYIDFKDNIIRKGAVSANSGELLLIPMNMRDGSLLCTGKGNSEWNCSAPHGAGRIMSRRKARDNVSLEEYVDSMSGIYSSSVCESTIDESPMAYKNIDEIISNIGDTVEIIDRLKVLYNYKAK